MNKRVLLFLVFLLVGLIGLISMLIYWGHQSIKLKEEVVADQIKLAINDAISLIEDDHYCFDLRTETSMPQLDSFFIINPVDPSGKDILKMSYIDPSSGKNKFVDQIPISAPAYLQMHLKFDFDEIPEFKPDSELTSFEAYIRGSYNRFLYDSDRNRLIDTTTFDSLLLSCVTPLFQEARIAFKIIMDSLDQTLYDYEVDESKIAWNADVMTYIFKNEQDLPKLRLELMVLNKADMFGGEKLVIYLGAVLFSAICFIFVAFLIKIQLKQKNILRLQRDFIHGMTHEFNTPISNIKLVAQNLIRLKDDNVKKSAEILKEEGRKLETGINLVLTTALIEKEELFLQKTKIDAIQFLEKTLEKNRTELSGSGIDFTLNSSCYDQSILVDIFHMENVIQNLINNVIKHSGASLLKISIENNDDALRIRFIDNGRGIRSEDKDRIFEKFARTGDSNRKNGYGLGLYYSKMILDLHGGKFYLEDNVEGAAFNIDLPL